MRFLLCCFLLLAGRAGAAHPAPPDTLRPVSPDRLWGYTYANDFFFRTDYYFTQGMTFRLVHPALARLPTRHLLPGGTAGSTQYHGLALRYDGFTPLRIQDDFVRVGDRPYSAYLYASFFRVSNQVVRKQRLTTALDVGVIGPAAAGKEQQTAIHRLTHNVTPRGWDYQLRNAPVLGYHATYERQLLAAPGHAELLSCADASLGTLYTYAGAGLQLRLGGFNSYFANLGVAGTGQRAGLRAWQFYGLATAEARLIGYDGSLQGGLFAADEPYTLSASAIRRLVPRSTGGVVLAHAGWQFSAIATWIAPEFAGGRSHRWGQLGVTRAW